MVSAVNYASTNLKELRASAEMSRNDLLRELEDRGVTMHTTTLRRLEEGSQQMKVDELVALCDIFELSLDDFATRPVDELTARLTEALRDVRNARRTVGFYLSNYLHELDKAAGVLAGADVPSAAQSSTVREIEAILKNDNEQRENMKTVMQALMSESPNGEG